jgi:hypothetical protein
MNPVCAEAGPAGLIKQPVRVQLNKPVAPLADCAAIELKSVSQLHIGTAVCGGRHEPEP